MTIETFAEQFHLITRRSEDGTTIIPGRHGQLYEYGDHELGVLIMPPPSQVRLWGHVRKAMIAVGMTLRQNGDHEGALSFDPLNKKAAKLAIKLAGIRRKRVASPAQLLALLKARSAISARGSAQAAL